MKIFYQNVNRIKTKTTDLYLSSLNFDYDIICITETNLNSGFFDNELLDLRYNVFRRDRETSCINKKEGGGVLIAIKKTYVAVRMLTWESSVEDLWINIKPNDYVTSNIYICVCYLPPDLPIKDQNVFYSNCQNILSNITSNSLNLIVGDFNVPGISWVRSGSTMIPNKSNDAKSLLLLNTLALCELSQFNHIPNKNGKLLDLILCNTSDLVVTEAQPLSRVDHHHPPLCLSLERTRQKAFLKKNLSNIYNFNKCNYDEIKKELSAIDWPAVLLTSRDVDVVVDRFYKVLNSLIEKYTPHKKSNINDSFPGWYSPQLIKRLREKLKFHKKFKKYGNPKDYDQFAHIRTTCKEMIKNCYKAYVSSVEECLKDNIKSFWKYINSKKSTKDIPQFMKHVDRIASDGQNVCELFSSFFGSVFEPNTQPPLDVDTCPATNSCLSNIILSGEEVLIKLKALDSSKGAGPDGIPPIFLKECALELCSPLTIIFNLSLLQGTFPAIWKIAHVTPIYKSGDRSDCSNYRPISILSGLAKLLEKVVYEYIYNHVSPLLSQNQHGFMRRRSTVTNLMDYKNYLCTVFAKGGQVDSIYTDFTKAFDKVNHHLLCRKLDLWYGLHGNLLRWISSYLTRRSQLVALKGYKSGPITVTSGVPQGSHLGPLLFIIFIDDLIGQLNCPSLLYADDLKIFNNINNINDCQTLQHDLNLLSAWCLRNHMHLNPIKCQLISFTKKKKHKIYFNYKLSGQTLNRTAAVRDLGVTFDEQLSFREHYEDITMKSLKTLGFIARSTVHFRNPDSLIYLFNSLVRSRLEYGSVIWSPNYAVHSDNIEAIQNKCLKIAAFRSGLGRRLVSSSERRSHFKVTSLETRRKQQDLLHLHKIVHSEFDSPNLLRMVNFNTRCFLRNRQKLFTLQTYRNNTSYYNPLVRMCRLYNELSQEDDELDICISKHVAFRYKVKHILN